MAETNFEEELVHAFVYSIGKLRPKARIGLAQGYAISWCQDYGHWQWMRQDVGLPLNLTEEERSLLRQSSLEHQVPEV